MPTTEQIAEYAELFGWGFDYNEDESYSVFDVDMRKERG